jgi:undecaprenyldiphospho-muramoylpentapeptide beta-N-acetylglucosaminyltransferase
MVCAGASGGGVYPALAVLQALDKTNTEVLWVGGEGGMESDLVKRAGINFTSVPAGQVHGVGIKAIIGIWKLMLGYFAARKIISNFSPDVLFFTGGFVAIPVGFAGKNIPTLLCLPDVEPGLALKVLSKTANIITVPSEKSKQYFSRNKNIDVTGYPTRPKLKLVNKKEAATEFGLDSTIPTLLVTGGSKGALSINNAIWNDLLNLLEKMQIIHTTGDFSAKYIDEKTRNLPEDLKERYKVFPYLHEEMGKALSLADLVVSRAGASILGEYPIYSLPAILIPYPHAWRYQKVNAEHLVDENAAIILEDEALPANLSSTIISLITNTEKLSSMKEAMASLATKDAPEKIAKHLITLAADNTKLKELKP